MTYLYEKVTFDFEHSYIKNKMPVFECNAKNVYPLSKNKRGKILTQGPLEKIEIIR